MLALATHGARVGHDQVRPLRSPDAWKRGRNRGLAYLERAETRARLATIDQPLGRRPAVGSAAYGTTLWFASCSPATHAFSGDFNGLSRTAGVTRNLRTMRMVE